MIECISNFIENVRLESTGTPTQHRVIDSGIGHQLPEVQLQPGPSCDVQVNPPTMDDATKARSWADKKILEVERFKAAVNAPQGLSLNFMDNAIQGGQFDGAGFPRSQCNPIADSDDDNFFHLTCHIEPNLRSKIERGEFVDLEKLLPRDRLPPHRLEGDNKMEMVNCDGAIYFIPTSDRDAKINNLHKWDQTFRVYAAIYCKSNPARSAEIWQYVYVIHTAAATFQWDNVAWYDYTFRQLMAAKPHRSWSKIYTQFWNLAMGIPANIQQIQNQRFSMGKQNSNKKYGDWHDNCCWVFNRMEKCTRPVCGFANCCSYCSGYNHRRFNCRSSC